ncbi:1,4-dihydroxy-2-naphthoyl-CoA synthase [Actinobacteria bacterium YIM 96077]|uniref:1,4-dihydroxy-2-naphthoyl-CoA synthase n=1 Tax=Phytoactinopolyspora halophila TaxID=1981511 RepID=A0A329QN94_9ACTN|nr:enoyl-CoA hydratase/isomerase family protein [Phytoactinopolyspora halophila]AYY12273.1 1,4-dihydroxy-2-naphthoyl-CoA synthase [Actinobacteria bacterium YIM 96077]RAW13810.1 1,4-dihydroxy-2-naphthoyl-CoA synthase [Phytoactinopolyspora halophila]
MAEQREANTRHGTQLPPELQHMSCQLDAGIAWITVHTGRNDNAMTTRAYDELLACIRWAGSHRACRVIVLDGRSNFSAGGDWALHKERDTQNFRDHLSLLFDIAIAMRTCGRPVIAAVRGRCTGGMNQIAAIADLTIAADDAIFGQHGCRTGSYPIFWGTQLLPRIVGEKKAREMIYMSWEYTAQEALEMGLLNRIAAPERLDDEVVRYCERIKEASPRSLRFAKTSINAGSDFLYTAIWHARDALAEFTGTDEWHEAIDSYLERRAPQWVEHGPQW